MAASMHSPLTSLTVRRDIYSTSMHNGFTETYTTGTLFSPCDTDLLHGAYDGGSLPTAQLYALQTNVRPPL